MDLSAVQQRVVGSLIEKELVHPDNYPLSMNALLLACNQVSNREPVMELDNHTLENTLHNLRSLDIVRMVTGQGNRVDKFRHLLDQQLRLDRAELGIVGILLLRGPQTAAEVRSRGARLHEISSTDQLESTLRSLAERDEPVVAQIPRQRGEKAQRWMHLLGPVEIGAAAGAGGDEGRVRELEAKVRELEAEIVELRAQLGAEDPPPSIDVTDDTYL